LTEVSDFGGWPIHPIIQTEKNKIKKRDQKKQDKKKEKIK